MIETEARLRRELEGLRVAASSSGGLLAAGSANLGAAEIQTRIRRVIEASGGTLKSMGNAPAKAKPEAAAPAGNAEERVARPSKE